MQKEIAKYDALKNWAIENGAEFAKFEIKYLLDKNRYVIASEDIQKGEIIASIPDSLSLHYENPKIKPLCLEYGLTGFECITVFLTIENKNEKGFFYPFINFLPLDFDFYPAFYSADLNKLIKGSLIERRHLIWEKIIQDECNEIKVNF